VKLQVEVAVVVQARKKMKMMKMMIEEGMKKE
jgi:hypothetical protein